MKQLNIPLVIQNLDLNFIKKFYENNDLCFLSDVNDSVVDDFTSMGIILLPFLIMKSISRIVRFFSLSTFL